VPSPRTRKLGGIGMLSHIHFATAAEWLLFAIIGLLWAMVRALTAAKMEKQGIAFRKGFLAVLVLIPLAELIAIFIARILPRGR
jgi:hypothetical protein